MKEKELIKSFVNLTKAPEDIARKYLERNHWSIDYSLNDYYDHELGNFTDITVPVEAPKYPDELVQLFNRYADPDAEQLSLNGIGSYIEDLGLQLDDLVTICLAKLLNWEHVTDKIHKSQFLSIWFLQGCSHITEMKMVLNDLRYSLKHDKNYFSEVYKFTFRFNLDPTSSQKTLDTDMAIEYWKLFFLDPKETYAVTVDHALVSMWFEFLESTKKQEIYKDCWDMLLQFFIKFPNLSTIASEYDETDVWPYIIDEFHEYLQDTGILS